MMKKISIFFLALILMFSMVGCGAESDPQTSGAAGEAGVFDLEQGTVLLNSGYEMPINGLGTYSLHGDECINSVKSALSNGVRLIDT